MLFQTNRHSRRSKPQLLTNGSISLLDGLDNGHDPKKKAASKPEGEPKIQKQAPPQSRRTQNTGVQPLKEQPAPAPVVGETLKLKSSKTTTITENGESHSVSSTSSKASPKRRHVRFHSVELQEYSVTVGDHPLCKGYFPLTLDWSHAKPKEFRINDYERQRLRDRCALQELHMDVHERWERLRLVTGLPQSTLAHLELSRHGTQCAAA